MKLRNKKTGEIVEWFNNTDGIFPNSLAELNSEWEDYEEEGKEYYTLNSSGQIWTTECFNEESIKNMESIGNYFSSREEAELAVRKLKAWKRLKNKGFRFEKWVNTSAGSYSPIWFYFEKDTVLEDVKSDLDLLFGGEE